MMKKTPTRLARLLFLIPVLFLSACKKDALVIENEKTFVEVNYRPQSSSGEQMPWTVTLKPDGNTFYIAGGDVGANGVYKISGKTLSIQSPNGKELFKFEIRSETDIQLEETQLILRWNNK